MRLTPIFISAVTAFTLGGCPDWTDPTRDLTRIMLWPGGTELADPDHTLPARTDTPRTRKAPFPGDEHLAGLRARRADRRP